MKQSFTYLEWILICERKGSSFSLSHVGIHLLKSLPPLYVLLKHQLAGFIPETSFLLQWPVCVCLC